MNSNFYIHDTDRKALQALKAIPGFPQLLKAYMKIWNEKQFHIYNMATNLRISDNQLSKYYNMLPPICNKLGIEIPELYLKLDVVANAYTSGDTNPVIIITSGLLETLPDELIPTVLAHECGHIACHHCLYTDMAHIILSKAASLLHLGDLALEPIRIAFAYWLRCSELSADRAAALYDGTADNMVKICTYFAGFDKDIDDTANIDEFINQALTYKKMINDSKWNRTMEFILFQKKSHPLNAVRALECLEWSESERFKKMVSYINSNNQNDDVSISAYLKEIPMPEPVNYYVGRNLCEVLCEIQKLGFKNITTRKVTQKGLFVKQGQVVNIRIDAKDGFEMCDWYAVDSEIVIEYYEQETADEVAAAHPNQLRVPNSSKNYIGKQYVDVINEFQKAGFTHIEQEEQRKSKKGLLSKNGNVASVSVNGQTQFIKDEWFDEKSIIKIIYHTYEK